MIHPATEVRYINSTKGYGLFATQFIPRGTILWVRDQLDREISPEDLLKYDEMVRQKIINYSYRNHLGHYIFCWDNARFMNHDRNPNSCITAYNVELAVQDILEGDEIVNHYGMLNIIEAFAVPDSGGEVIHPDDLLSLGKQWDALLETAFACLSHVDQPLRPLIGGQRWTEFLSISRKEKKMQSVTSCCLQRAAHV